MGRVKEEIKESNRERRPEKKDSKLLTKHRNAAATSSDISFEIMVVLPATDRAANTPALL